ncbi:YbbR-like domain-containing protein [Flavobacteriaceae bacterium]|nr:YbbR-like domain-containing protein [Flavobacteriaceae bacterium]
MTKFSKPLVAEFRLNLEYTNFPQQTLVSTDAPKVLTVTVNANGFKLLTEFFSDKSLVIDLSAGRLLEDDKIRFSQDQLLAFCYRKMPAAGVISLDTKELIVPIDRMAAKEIEVLFQGEVSLSQGFKMIGPPKIEPNKITVYGPSQIIDTISSIRTIYTRLEGLRNNINQAIALESLFSNELSRSQDSIFWSAQILEYTQKQIELSVELINVPRGKKLQIFPEMMTLSVEIPVNEYALYDKSNFRLICDYTERISEDSFMIPRLSQLPQGVFKPELSHKKVDYVEFAQ